MKTISKLIAGAALSAGLMLSAAGVASAADTTPKANAAVDLDGVKARCTAAIDRRVAELDVLTTRVGASKQVSDSHRTALNDTIASAKSGLTSLRGTIAADSDLKTLRADCEKIVSDYRIYALRVPQTHLVLGFDTESAAIAKLDDAEQKLSAAIDDAAAHGKDTTHAAQLLSDMQAKLADATTQVSGKADAVIGLQPADWNADHGVLTPYVGSFRSARIDLRAAAQDAKGIVAALKG
jgi:hypothetical protein